MSFKLVSFVVFCILAVSNYCNGHTYHSGECPSVEPMSGFDINQVRFGFQFIYLY